MGTTLLQKLRLLSAFWKVVKNPLDVRDFNETTDLYLDRAAFADVFAKLNKDETCRKALESRILITAVPPEAFNFFGKGTFGRAYRDFMQQHKLVVMKVGFDKSNPVSYLRYRYRHYNHLWRVFLGYDITPFGQVSLHAFLYVQTHSPVSMIYMALSLIHCALFNRGNTKAVFQAIIDGWQKGHAYKMMWGVPLETCFSENLEALRTRHLSGDKAGEAPPPRLMAQ